jgi:hypothetical protein
VGQANFQRIDVPGGYFHEGKVFFRKNEVSTLRTEHATPARFM